ncbi:hypothetical protein SLEP1_g54964 [Rubroshorea leprosula]|uniref:Uncharacterized protein n=1 Tax=Rubroshorea leprosula TaxID=152421 RepID=A0AAV5MF47_9ROSI|nr:hypothetical protein SLEP1_g54964 [Rubroshorea leprosula]
MVIRNTLLVLGLETLGRGSEDLENSYWRLPYQLWTLKRMSCVLMLQSLA